MTVMGDRTGNLRGKHFPKDFILGTVQDHRAQSSWVAINQVKKM